MQVVVSPINIYKLCLKELGKKQIYYQKLKKRLIEILNSFHSLKGKLNI